MSIVSQLASGLPEGAHNHAALAVSSGREASEIRQSRVVLGRSRCEDMSLFCSICGSVSAWELWWVAAEGE